MVRRSRKGLAAFGGAFGPAECGDRPTNPQPLASPLVFAHDYSTSTPRDASRPALIRTFLRFEVAEA